MASDIDGNGVRVVGSSNLPNPTYFLAVDKLEKLPKHKLEQLTKEIRKIYVRKYKAGHNKTKYGNINKGFTQAELDRFLSSVANPKAYLAFYLMSHMGFRVSEVCSIKASDIDWHNNQIRIGTLKAKTGDFLTMPASVQKLLLAWVQKFPQEIAGHDDFVLFSINQGWKRKHISPNWLRNAFREAALLSNLNQWYDKAADDKNPRHAKCGARRLYRLTTHSLRHYFITTVYDHCKNPMVTQKLARHQDFKSTQVYINLNLEKLTKTMAEVFNPETSQEQEELQEFLKLYLQYKRLKLNQ